MSSTGPAAPPLRRIALLTSLALVGFAGNSLLCRLALARGAIDAASFTAIRLVSGALVLVALARPRAAVRAGSAVSAAALFAYAAPFSYAYLRLGAGLGALVLFGSVQAAMLGWAVARGERPGPLVWLGLVLALAGLVGLAAPGRTSPDPIGLGAMVVAGVSWAIYTLRGRRAGSPLATTAANFARSVPLAAALVVGAALLVGLSASGRGVALAVASGAIASGMGYSLWYAALPHLSATRAAVLQLLVPVLAAGGGVGLLGERVSPRLLVAGGAILGGVALALVGRAAAARRPA